MLTVRADFEKRCSEIKVYLSWLADMERSTRDIPGGLPSTMKAAAMLLLYNLVESTMTNAVEAVFDELQRKKVSFDLLSAEFKSTVLSNVKNCAAEKLTVKLVAITTDIISSSFDKAKVFNGNVDCKKIRETLKDFGVRKTHAYDEGRLHDIMVARNRLAHGAESFGDYGKDLTASQLLADYECVIGLLTYALNDFESYIGNRHYLGVV